jgi:hypothetical protein
VNSRQQVLSGAIEPPKYRFSRIDLFIGLCLLVLVGFAVQLMLRDVVTEQRPPLAETPAYVTQAPSHVFYDPYETRSLIGEIGGCVLTLIILAGARWRLRRRPPEPRLDPLPDAPSRSVQGVVVRPIRWAPVRGATSASIAAERLSAVVWTDQLARREAKRA